MANAKKLPSGNWRCRATATINGKKVTKSFTAPTKPKAEELASKWQQIRNNPENCTLSQAIEDYINFKRELLSPTTIATYKKIKRNYFLPLMNKKVSQITEQHLQQEINFIYKNHSSKTVKSAYGFISTVLKFKNPYAVYNVMLPKKEKRIREPLQASDIEKIIKSVTDTEIEIPTLIALCGGLRMSEIRALTFNDLKNNQLYVNKAIVDVDGVPTLKETKTVESTRIVKIPQFLADKINSIEHENQNETIIKLSGQAIYKRYKRLLAKQGIERYTFHDLRHINASVMLMLGVPDKYAMSRGGWSTNEIMKSVYQEFIDEEQNRTDNRINEYFEDISKKVATKIDTSL